MEIIFLLIPLSLVLVGAAVWAFSWAAKSGQFDDMDSPALSILDDDHIDTACADAMTQDENQKAETKFKQRR